MPDLIDIRGVSHAYRTPAGPLPVLEDLNISVPEATFCAVVGPRAAASPPSPGWWRG